MVRLFVALPIAATVRSALTAAIRELRERGWPVRWVRDDGLHLTLRFLGEVGDERVDPIAAAVRDAAAGLAPIGLAVAGLGTLPSGRRARVVVATLDAPPALELLAHRLERAMIALGFAAEGRPFRPHVTLGRVRPGATLPAAAPVELAGRRLALPFLADAVVLYESRLAPGGSVYSPRATVALEPQWAV